MAYLTTLEVLVSAQNHSLKAIGLLNISWPRRRKPFATWPSGQWMVRAFRGRLAEPEWGHPPHSPTCGSGRVGQECRGATRAPRCSADIPAAAGPKMSVIIGGTEYFTVPEVLEDVGVTRQTLWRWRKARSVPSGHRYRDGSVLFSREDLESIREYGSRLDPIGG